MSLTSFLVFSFTESSTKEAIQTVKALEKAIVPDSFRSCVPVSGNVMGKALNNLDSLVKLPTGCGEQNLVKVATCSGVTD